MKYFVTKLSLCVSDEGWRWQIAWSIGDLALIVGGQRGDGSSFRFASVQCVQNRRHTSVLQGVQTRFDFTISGPVIMHDSQLLNTGTQASQFPLFPVHNITLTKQAMQVQRDIEVRSCNHCCSGKAVSIT